MINCSRVNSIASSDKRMDNRCPAVSGDAHSLRLAVIDKYRRMIRCGDSLKTQLNRRGAKNVDNV